MERKQGNSWYSYTLTLIVLSFVSLTFSCANPPEQIVGEKHFDNETPKMPDVPAPRNTVIAYPAPRDDFYFCSTGGIANGCCSQTDFPKIDWPATGMLFRGENTPLVYYLASNGKRYVFPNADTLISWHESFESESLLSGESDICESVVQVSDKALMTIPMGGNVTFRPGSYIVVLESYPAYPNRYIVGRGGGILHEVSADFPMDRLYCDTVWQRVRAVPDAFFVNYTLGEAFVSLDDYDPEEEFYGANIEVEIGVN